MRARHLMGIAVLVGVAVGCATRTPMPLALVDVQIDRGVDASDSGRATLSPGQFRFNPDLSTFAIGASAPVAKPCLYRFTAVGVPSPPTVGASGAIQDLQGYVATFDNNPPGHWGIAAPAGTSPASAAAAVSAYAQAHRQNVVPGTAPKCT